MKKIKNYSIILFFAFADNLFSQQETYLTHFQFNKVLYNSAYSGLSNQFCISSNSHQQWRGYTDRTLEFNPESVEGAKLDQFNTGAQTNLLTINSPLPLNFGAGLVVMKDVLGYEKNTHLKLLLSKKFELKNNSILSFGFDVNRLQKGLEGKMLKPLAPNDPLVPNNYVTDQHLMFGSSVFYMNPFINHTKTKNLWMGLSVSNLNEREFVFINSKSEQVTFSKTKQHWYLMSGITFLDLFSNPDIVWKPALMIKRNTVTQFELSNSLEIKNQFTVGNLYRTSDDAMSFFIGYKFLTNNLKGLRIGYAYDITLSRIRLVSSGSHELQLNYCFDISHICVIKPFNLIHTPRFLNTKVFQID